MTVSSETSSISYAGNGTTVAFAFPYLFFEDADLAVFQVAADGTITPLVLNVGYTVDGAGLAIGGTVTTTTAPAAGTTLTILRDPALLQESQFVSTQPFPSATVERGYDYLTMIDQRQAQQIRASIHYPDGETNTDGTLTSVATRKGTYLFFDAVTGAISYALNLAVTTLTQAVIGGLLYPRTAAEVTAGITPTNYAYAPPDIRRYGADSTGATDISAALAAADLVAVNGGGSTVFYPGTYKLSANVTTTKPLVFLAGAVISIDNTKTLTANGQVIALSGDPNTGLGTLTYGYEVNLFTNAFGFGIGKDPANNSDDFVHIRRDVNTATGINVYNQSAGALGETYWHLFSDVANAGASLRASVNSIAGGALADIVASQNLAFSIIQASAAPLNFYVNNTLMCSFASVVSPVNYWQFKGGAAASAVNVAALGSDTNISITYDVKGTGSHFFRTSGVNQVEISNTTSANRRIVLTGSNGGNPKVDVSAGNLLLGGTATEIQWQKALVALGGGAAPTLGTIGGAGPTAAAQNTWLRFADSTGAIGWLAVWK